MSIEVVQVSPVNPLCLVQFFKVEDILPNCILSVSILFKNAKTKASEATLVSFDSNNFKEVVDDEGNEDITVNAIISHLSLVVFQKMMENNTFNIAVCSIYNETKDPFFSNSILELFISKERCKLSNLI